MLDVSGVVFIDAAVANVHLAYRQSDFVSRKTQKTNTSVTSIKNPFFSLLEIFQISPIVYFNINQEEFQY